ncbi:MAG: hypothetical protein HY801_04700 [Candidatus Lindowbacteria bacterium]|nr:hypothetical protein [Candidatus Lindowbacteria bacterium]
MTYKKILLIQGIYLILVVVCFGDALNYYFTKEDFLQLDIGGGNSFIKQMTPHLMIFRPLTHYGYFAAGRFLFGLNPPLWHSSNLVLHAFTALLVCLFAHRMISDSYVSFLSGLLYLTHLANIHLIYWVTSAIQTLSLITALAVWLLYLEAVKRDRWSVGALCTFAFALALMANEVNVMVPVMTITFWWFFLKASERRSSALRINLWLWATLTFYVLVRVIGYWHGGGQKVTQIYDMKISAAIPRNIVEMLAMTINSLYFLSNVLVEKGTLNHLYDLLWNWAMGSLVLAGAIVCIAKREPIIRFIRNHSHTFKSAVFCLLWIFAFMLPASYIPIVWPWRITNSLVGYNLLLAYVLTRVSGRRAGYLILIAALVIWGWWGMAQIRKYGDPYIRIDHFQKVCRNIAADTDLYLKLYPEVAEILTPSLYSNDEFFVATFAGQQFRLLLPKRVSYLLSAYEHDAAKHMMVLSYSERDSHLYLQEIVRPEQR